MTVDLAERGIRLVLVDIEGTTTPIAFVDDVLFPFARRHLAAWCREHAETADYREVLLSLAFEHAADRTRGEAVPDWRADTPDRADTSLQTYALWLMDRDRKSPGLKLLQGFIWDEGYRAGALRGVVYPDVPEAISRWHAMGVGVAVYSSGSKLAQRRLFGSTPHGDLTPLVRGFFDTTVGPKHAHTSYERIVAELGEAPMSVLFVSDVTTELRAAADAGCQTVLSIREGNRPQPDADAYPHIHTFEEIV